MPKRVNLAIAPRQSPPWLSRETSSREETGVEHGQQQQKTRTQLPAQWEASMLSEDPEEAAKAGCAMSFGTGGAMGAMATMAAADTGAGKETEASVCCSRGKSKTHGFSVGEITPPSRRKLRHRAIIDGRWCLLRRLPIVEIVLDRVRLMTTSLPHFTSNKSKVARRITRCG